MLELAAKAAQTAQTAKAAKAAKATKASKPAKDAKAAEAAKAAKAAEAAEIFLNNQLTVLISVVSEQHDLVRCKLGSEPHGGTVRTN